MLSMRSIFSKTNYYGGLINEQCPKVPTFHAKRFFQELDLRILCVLIFKTEQLSVPVFFFTPTYTQPVHTTDKIILTDPIWVNRLDCHQLYLRKISYFLQIVKWQIYFS